MTDESRMHSVRVVYNGGDDEAVLEYDATEYTVEEAFDMAETEVENAYGPRPDIKTVELDD